MEVGVFASEQNRIRCHNVYLLELERHVRNPVMQKQLCQHSEARDAANERINCTDDGVGKACR